MLPFAWSWLVILGTAGTMLLAVALSYGNVSRATTASSWQRRQP